MVDDTTQPTPPIQRAFHALLGGIHPPRRETQALPPVWNAELVGDRLVQAFVTLDRLPPLRGPRKLGSNWPSTAIEWGDLVGIDPCERKMREEAANRTVIRASAIDIAHMEMAFEWLKELRVEDSGMALIATFWALRTARGRSIKRLCIEKHWAPRTFFRKRAMALASLAASLNRRAIPVF